MKRGRGRGGKYEIFCFKCGVAGHKAWECPYMDGKKPEGKTHIVEVEPTVANNEVVIFQQEQGENLMMRKIFLQSEKETKKELKQRKTLFRTK